MKKQELSSLSNIDGMANPKSFIQLLDNLSTMEFFQNSARETFALLDVQEGDHILDVGCGTGEDVRALAQRVGKTGRVVGVDISETMITEARRRAEGLNLPVEYRVADVQLLDFPDSTFDGCRTCRVLIHMENPRQALAEIFRVVRSGGTTIAFEPDWETTVIDAPDKTLTRKITNFWCDSFRSGWIGRQLPTHFKRFGLTDIAVFPRTIMVTDYTLVYEFFMLRNTLERAQEAGVISACEIANWSSHLEETSQAGHFFCAITGFGVSGKKP